MALSDDLLFAFEIHSAEKIRSVLAAGLDPKVPINGKAPIRILTEMYLRSPRFVDCLRVILDAERGIGRCFDRNVLVDGNLGACLARFSFSTPCVPP